MTNAPAKIDIPKKPTERRAWINYQLKLKGTTFRAIAREFGCSHATVQNVAGGRANEDLEAVLAKIIGVSHRDLFPDHFDAAGVRLPLARKKQRKSTPPSSQRNVYSEKVA